MGDDREDGNGSDLSSFGSTATGLSRSPLQIIALFIVLVYGFAALVVGAKAVAKQDDGAAPLTWFLVVFPVLVLAVFTYLVVKHHRKLYGPSDFRDDNAFLVMIRETVPGDVRRLPEMRMQEASSDPELVGQPSNPGVLESIHERGSGGADESVRDLARERKDIKDRSHHLALVHTVVPSQKSGQKYDVFLYLTGGKRGKLQDVAGADFFFGRYWGNQVFKGERSGESFGVRTSAYGPFWAICRVTFQNKTTVILSRYVDFEMGELLRKAAQRAG